MLNPLNVAKAAKKLSKLSESHLRKSYALYTKKWYSIAEEEKLIKLSSQADHGAQLLNRIAHD